MKKIAQDISHATPQISGLEQVREDFDEHQRIGLIESADWLEDCAEVMEEEGLDRENNSRHFRAGANAIRATLDSHAALDTLFLYHGYTSHHVNEDKQKEVWNALQIIRAALTIATATSMDDGWNYDVSQAPRDGSWFNGLFKRTYINASKNKKETKLVVLPIKFNLESQCFHAFGDIFATSLGEFIAYMPRPETPTIIS
ncbi:MAG: hypothetical protein E6R03_12110 [Hyphomicrobiaceae bacterium]|nr:MAG: hypothetical protein E6R03_12110 [Hyphomicrobiaceae bacterium]